MKHIRNTTFVCICFFTLIFSSCKKLDKDDSSSVDSEGVDQTEASEKLNTVETDTPARAEKISTEFVYNDTTYALPEVMCETTEESNLSKVELLINASSSSSAKIAQEENAFAWLLDSKNGSTVPEHEKFIMILHLDGKYKNFWLHDKTAEWGYTYVN